MRRVAYLCTVCLISSCSPSQDDTEPDSAADAPAIASSQERVESAPRSFTLFESGQVRPLALSPDRSRLFAVNTPDNRLEIFDIGPHGLTHRASVSVGLEPVSVAARNNHEVWVVNHLSDSVSVVNVKDPRRSRVVRTLLVGDEPRDIVFAGPGRRRAFITTAHRGQNSPNDPQLTTPGVGRADVWVFDAGNLGSTLGGNPLSIVALFGDTPRALEVTPDGKRVYAAAFHSGNRTTSIHENHVPDGGEAAGGIPGPATNFEGVPRPETSLIAKFDGTHWVDELGRVWDDKVKFSLPDKDVFVIDAMASPPSQVAGPAGYFQGVGTILYNMAVNPVNGKIYVTNTEAFNDKRFEGPGLFGGQTVRGHLHESRITVLSGAGVAPRHLNKHIDYSACCAPIPNAENAKSLATPLGMAITKNGAKLYVSAFGSSKIGVFSTSQLESDTFVPSAANQIPVSGGGPTGLVLDEPRKKLYVLTRFDNSISVINTTTNTEVAHVPMYSPEPESIVRGRRFLYDAAFSSSHGDSSCGSCHVFGDFDSLAWNLGNPDDVVRTDEGLFVLRPSDFGFNDDFHSMKGPMTTQSLRGLANHGPMHWRGDRTGGDEGPSVQPDSGIFDEVTAFKEFSVAFTGLLGRSEPIPDEDMQAFTDFALQITYPPNPIRALDNSLTPEQDIGRDFFENSPSEPGEFPCSRCHVLDPTANAEFGVAIPGFFGTDGRRNFDAATEGFKIPHLRNLYQKVGMFGFAPHPNFNFIDHEHMGDQVRGFGFVHDGSTDTMFRFHTNLGFSQASPFGFASGAFPDGPPGNPLRRAVEAYLLVFASNMAPIVGQQVTLTSSNAAAVGPRIDLLIARADVGECDLVAKARVLHADLGFLYRNGKFISNRVALPPIADALLRQLSLVADRELTYTCVPPGSGVRIGLDRDEDGFRDGDEEDHHTDPADPTDHP
ncbi:beta-propeller fold lactonase family protein [Sorangium sp. So ce362]|uniref:beta-propeller fold lactonase family protein n=1 Tax=Sorangium sp. So ce362 TaxID=3133303 RepID=UPI003F637784